MAGETTTCCPPFQPEIWDEKEVTWQGKPFVKDRVRSFLHMPLNFGTVFRRNWSLIEAADAAPDKTMVLSNENSLWGADMYIAVTRDVPSACMTTLSGTFPYQGLRGPVQEHSALDRPDGPVRQVARQVRQLAILLLHDLP